MSTCVNLKDLMVSIAGLYNLISETDNITNTVNLWQRDDYYSGAIEVIDAQEIATDDEVKQLANWLLYRLVTLLEVRWMPQ